MAHKKVRLISTHGPNSGGDGLTYGHVVPLVCAALKAYARTRDSAQEIAESLATVAVGDFRATADLCRHAARKEAPWLYDITRINGLGVSISFDSGRMSIALVHHGFGHEVTVDFGADGSNERAEEIWLAWGEKALYVQLMDGSAS